MTATAGMESAAQERLDAVLAAPPTGRSRHTQTIKLAHAGTPRNNTSSSRRLRGPHGPQLHRTFSASSKRSCRTSRLDRQNERFVPTAFNGAIDRIRKAGKATPVLFGHELGNVHAVLGMIPPDGWSVHHDGLRARGWVDTTDPIGAKLFKMLRSNALQWSIGFSLIGGKNATRGPDGVVVLEQVDELFELSVTPLPANSRTRTIGAKAERIPTHAELLERETALGLDGALARLEHGRRVITQTLDELHAHEDALRNDGVIAAVERMRYRRAPDLDTAVARMREQTREGMTRLLGGKAHRPRRPRDELRDRADQASRDYALDRALTFDPRA